MKLCPKCRNDDTKVLETRSTTDEVYRLRGCMGCSHMWATSEVLIPMPQRVFTLKSFTPKMRAAREQDSVRHLKPKSTTKTRDDYMREWVK